MTDAEAVEATKQGWSLLAEWSSMVSMLPLEDWLCAIDRAETIGPIAHADLWRYSHASLADVKELIEAAMPLKQKVLKMQRRLRESGETAPGA